MSFVSSQHVKHKGSPSSIVPIISRTGSPKSGSEVNKVGGERSPTPQRMDTLSLSTTYLFRASDMFKKKAITSDGFRCHILTIHQKLDDAASAREVGDSGIQIWIMKA